MMMVDSRERLSADGAGEVLAMVPPSMDQTLPIEPLRATRCSLRSLGKKRPNYALEQSEVMEVVPKPKKRPIVKKAKTGNTKQAISVSPLYSTDLATTCYQGAAQNGDGSVNYDPHIGAEKSSYTRVKETIRAFNSHYLHFVQEEETRYKQVVAALKKTPKAVLKSPKASKPKLNKNNQGGHSQVSKVTQLGECAGSIDAPQLGGNAVVSACEEVVKRASKRPDLKAITMMRKSGTVLYSEKRIGHLPGIDVGHQFYSRAEMVVTGLHKHWLNGIDYMGLSYANKEQYRSYKFPLAVCIVLSGMYEDDLDNSDDVIYTGQGGHDLLGNKKQIKDQKMAQGNLALKNCLDCCVPVRVIRGHESKISYCGKVYTYDGLYQVQKYWVEKGVSGFTVFKYLLKRQDGQPALTTNQVQFTRPQAPKSISELRGLVSEDISGGQENFPIPATNVVDDPPFAPADFVYCKSLQVSKYLKLPKIATGCICKGECIDPRICSCAQLNGSDFPYVRRNGSRLVEAKAVVFECGPKCGCKLSCVNRTSQQGLKYRLEVFRTPKKGWAVRSWEPIPAGAPICEYTGVLMKTDEIDNVSENNYIFDIDCLQTMKGLDGRERRPGDVSFLAKFDDKKLEAAEYCIDAGHSGNIARFINHSCQPNLFVQCVLSEHHDFKMAKVMLFAADTIPPLQELTYDYGYTLNSVAGPDGSIKTLSCYCGAADCRKRLY